MLTDGQWTMLEPLIDACRPHAKVLSAHLRRTIQAILWRHENGAKWRALPTELGPWWMVDGGADLHQMVAARCMGKAVAYGTGQKAQARHDISGRHQHPCASESSRCALKRASANERDDREALGRSRGGFGTKACVIADGAGRAIAFRVAPGQAHELPHAVPLLDRLPDVPLWVVADRGYTSQAFRQHIWDSGSRPAIPRNAAARHRWSVPIGSTTTATKSSASGRV